MLGITGLLGGSGSKDDGKEIYGVPVYESTEEYLQERELGKYREEY